MMHTFLLSHMNTICAVVVFMTIPASFLWLAICDVNDAQRAREQDINVCQKKP